MSLEVLEDTDTVLRMRATGRRSPWRIGILGFALVAVLVVLAYFALVAFVAGQSIIEIRNPIPLAVLPCVGLQVLPFIAGLTLFLVYALGDERVTVRDGVLEARREYRSFSFKQGRIDLRAYPPVGLEHSVSRRGVQRITVRGRRFYPVSFGEGLERNDAEQVTELLRARIEQYAPSPLGGR